MDNRAELDRIERDIRTLMADTMQKVVRVTFHGYASPEGTFTHNILLAHGRTRRIRQYICDRLPQSDVPVAAEYTPENWQAFRDSLAAVPAAEGIPPLSPSRRDSLLALIDSSLEPDARLALMQQRYPEEMQLIIRNLFPRLRYTDYTITYRTTIRRAIPRVTEYDVMGTAPAGPVTSGVFLPTDTATLPEENCPRPILAIKSNLLFDAAATPNLEVEVPIGLSRWSVMAEWWTPWLLWGGGRMHRHAHQLLNAGLEGRFWFKKRRTHCDPVLRGHFLGLYGAGGKYDVELFSSSHRGWQGEYTSAGLTYGYSALLNRHWRLEFSLSAGYVGGPQRYYKGMFNDGHLIWQRNQQLRYFGPTKLKVSIGYVIFERKHKEKKGGEQ